MSINSPERLIVRNKALYTSHSDKRRSTGTTLSVCECACVCVCVSDKVYYVCSLSSGPNRHTPETLPKHSISICTLSLSLFPSLLPLSPLHFSLCLPFTPPSVSTALLPPLLTPITFESGFSVKSTRGANVAFLSRVFFFSALLPVLSRSKQVDVRQCSAEANTPQLNLFWFGKAGQNSYHPPTILSRSLPKAQQGLTRSRG